MRRVLAIDCGGTRSSALLLSSDGELLREGAGGPANLHTASPAGVAAAVAGFFRDMPDADACAVAAAGLRTEAERRDMVTAIRSAGVSLPLAVFSDSEAALRAGGLREGVVVIAGTGSSAFALAPGQRWSRAGGWGPHLGDEGGAYWVGRSVLTRAVRALDEGDETGMGLLRTILEGLALQDVAELRRVASGPASVACLAGLAPRLGEAARCGNPLAAETFARAAEELVRLARLVARRAGLDAPVPVVLAGGLVRAYVPLLELFRQGMPAGFDARPLMLDPAWGAFWLAVERNAWRRDEGSGMSPTEQHDPRTAAIDQLDTLDMLRLMNDADAQVPPSVRGCLPDVARLVEETAAKLREGGRLVYVGAGTSGRLAMLDAVECVPTFGLEPGRVLALVAGGDAALTRAVEGAEDDTSAGHAAIDRARVSEADIVVGVSASGGAPYVAEALRAARERGARTGLVTCNPAAGTISLADIAVVAVVGPEVIAGSTRLKAGTAQKLILNMLSTAVMIRLGRTTGNRMSSMRPTNQKLRGRAVRLVAEIAEVGEPHARRALEAASWSLEEAIEHARRSGRDADPRSG